MNIDNANYLLPSYVVYNVDFKIPEVTRVMKAYMFRGARSMGNCLRIACFLISLLIKDGNI